MATFLAYLTVSVVVGCIYGLTASGLVVTHMTSGIFNFAHGAVGMVAAFTYWQLSVAWGVPVPLALALVLLVLAPLFGAAIERVLIRPLQGSASTDLSIVITLGLLLFLIGLANVLWKPTETRVLPPFFPGRSVTVGSLIVTYDQVAVVLVALIVAASLRLFFQRTRTGTAMRAVVDDPDLAAMVGARPQLVQASSWALGSSLAALAGILLAPLVNLEILTLTLLVINGYAAALAGRLRSLSLTAGAALVLGLVVNFPKIYLPPDSPFAQYQAVLPMLFLFVILVLSPASKLQRRSAAGASSPSVPGLRSSLVTGAGVLMLAVVLSRTLSQAGLITGGKVFVLGLTLLSLVLLTGYGGQVSLCQFTFVGLGAYAMGTWGGGSLLGLVVAVALSAAVGAAVALPTLRLRGLYLALATFAFANAMDLVFFSKQIGSGGSLPVPRVRLPGVPTQSDRAFFVLCAVVFVLASVGVLALRRGRYGRQLVALDESPAACATLGLNVNIAKLVLFSASAGLAGLSGALFGGLRGSIGPNDVVALSSLLLLLTLRIGGVNTVSGAAFGALTVAGFPLVQERFPGVPALAYLLTGLAAVSIGRDPNGFGGRVSDLTRWLRSVQGARGGSTTSAPPAPTPRPDDDLLVGADLDVMAGR